VWRVGPALGEDNDLVYGEWLGIPTQRLGELRAKGII
jgi:formyl-CoA transferase